MSKVWFVTGASRGFGRIWVDAALERGDKVAATARQLESLQGLSEKYGESVLTLALDVTDKGAVEAAVQQAHERFGCLDVVINNAGYGLFGMVEEVSEDEARAQIETNVFGALWVTRAVLPIMREHGSGHILQVSSIGGVHAFPGLGLYHASKWALEGFSTSLAQEVRGLGIKVTLVEPTGYSTDWGGSSAVHATPIAAYDGLRAAMAEGRAKMGASLGDPEATGAVILEVVDMAEPPLRIFLGRGPLEMIRADYADRIATWEQFDELSRRAHGSK